MDVGDLISWQGRVWVIRKADEQLVSAYAESVDGAHLLVDLYADEQSSCSVVASPVRDWPSVTLPTKSRARLKDVLNGAQSLTRFVDWVKLDEFQMGGQLYLNPTLNLGFRDRLTAVYVLSGSGRVDRCPVGIPRNFLSLSERTARAAALQEFSKAPPPEPPRKPNIYDALLSDDDEL